MEIIDLAVSLIHAVLTTLFYLFGLGLALKCGWNFALPFALIYKPSLVMYPGQKNLSLMPFEPIIVVLLSTLASVNDQILPDLSRLKLFAYLLGATLVSYVPIVAFHLYLKHWKKLG